MTTRPPSENRPIQADDSAVARRIKAKLPKSYVDFVRSVGPISFERVDEYEGFTATILRPNKLRPAGRAGDVDDVESTAVNGLTFATTAHGDDFRFDVQKGRKEYAVCLFKHESNLLEPYADNFAACVRRFVGDVR